MRLTDDVPRPCGKVIFGLFLLILTLFLVNRYSRTETHIELREQVFWDNLAELRDSSYIMSAIATCESGNRQFEEDGSVLRGDVNPKDVGLYQINEYYWLEKSVELDYDIYSANGNAMMANWIYKKHGTQPWKASKSCWSKQV